MQEAALKKIPDDRTLDYLFQQSPYEQFEYLKRVERKPVNQTGVVKILFNWALGILEGHEDPYPEEYYGH